MPSDPRTERALAALAEPIAAFQAALAATIDDVRLFLADRRSTVQGRVARVAAELGEFGADHIDPLKFAQVFDAHPAAVPGLELADRALRTLIELQAKRERLFVVTVKSHGDLCKAVDRALARAGRAFGAARLARAVRGGETRPREFVRGLAVFPYARWNKVERRLAPPLVAEVEGDALRPAGLAEFLDGRQKIVLVVQGPCSPAPLARLVTPRAFVLQTGDPAALERFAAWDGPGIAALVPEGAAQFVHDPSGGAAPWQRLTLTAKPSGVPRHATAGLSAAQQADELQLLEALAAAPPAPGAPGPAPAAAGAGAPAPTADPADKLAAWLLDQADLSSLP